MGTSKILVGIRQRKHLKTFHDSWFLVSPYVFTLFRLMMAEQASDYQTDAEKYQKSVVQPILIKGNSPYKKPMTLKNLILITVKLFTPTNLIHQKHTSKRWVSHITYCLSYLQSSVIWLCLPASFFTNFGQLVAFFSFPNVTPETKITIIISLTSFHILHFNMFMAGQGITGYT